MSLSINEIFSSLSRKCQADCGNGKSYLYEFQILGAKGGTWLLHSIDGLIEDSRTINCRVRISEHDFMSIKNGDLNPQLAFFEERMRIAGNFKAVLHLNKLLDLMH